MRYAHIWHSYNERRTTIHHTILPWPFQNPPFNHSEKKNNNRLKHMIFQYPMCIYIYIYIIISYIHSFPMCVSTYFPTFWAFPQDPTFDALGRKRFRKDTKSLGSPTPAPLKASVKPRNTSQKTRTKTTDVGISLVPMGRLIQQIQGFCSTASKVPAALDALIPLKSVPGRKVS